MILSELTQGGPPSDIVGGRIGPECSWRRDVALEMWIEMTPDLVTIRLQGTLDGSTGANLVDVVNDCLALGPRDLVFEMDGLHVEHSGGEVLRRVRAQVQGTGGRVRLGTPATA